MRICRRIAPVAQIIYPLFYLSEINMKKSIMNKQDRKTCPSMIRIQGGNATLQYNKKSIVCQNEI